MPPATMTEIFGEPISVYTRAEAIADGVLVDLTQQAKEAGWKLPVACTKSVWDDLNAIPKRCLDDVRGRVHDLLWMAFINALRHPNEHSYEFELFLRLGRARKARYQAALCGGDDGGTCCTIMQIGED